jgi:hypothetical protein
VRGAHRGVTQRAGEDGRDTEPAAEIVTDLTSSQWRAIEKASVYLPQDTSRALGRYIGLGTLREIIRKSKRTNSQNATLWMVYQQIIDRGGEDLSAFTKEDLHEFFLINYFGSDTHELFGLKRLKPHRRSSRLTKAEFADFLDHIVRFMAEKSVVLDLPGDVHA